MSGCKSFILCFLALIFFSSSVYGFIEGLYCGTENCYDGKKVSLLFYMFSDLVNILAIIFNLNTDLIDPGMS